VKVAETRIGDSIRRAERERAGAQARRSTRRTRSPWATVASAFRRERVPASAPTTPVGREPIVAQTM
jgi:hypothetical protein